MGNYLAVLSSDTFTPAEFDESELNYAIVSRLLSLNFVNSKINQTSFSAPILLTFNILPNQNSIENMVELKCVQWESDVFKWKTESCALAMRNKTHVLCECNIQTLKVKHFAVVADILTGPSDIINNQFQTDVHIFFIKLY